MNSINPLTGISPVNFKTSRPDGQTEPQKGSGGRILHATVLEEKPDKSYVLDIEGKHFQARGDDIRLSRGQKLRLQVVATSPQIELKIISDSLQNYLGRSLTLLGHNIDLSSLYAQIQTTVPPAFTTLSVASREILENYISLQQKSLADPDGGKIIQQLIERLGLALENHLANNRVDTVIHSLKAALLEVAELFKHGDKITDETHRLLSTIELYQLARLRLEHDKLLIFPLPVPFVDQGYLLLNTEDQKQQKDPQSISEELHFSLHLTLKPLGHVRVSFLRSNEGIHLRFDLDSEEKLLFFKTFEEELKTAHGAADIPVITITFSATAQDPGKELINLLLAEEDSMLDTRA